MDNQLQRIRDAESQLASMCRKLRLLFLTALVIFTITIAAIVWWIVFPPEGFSSFGLKSFIGLTPFLLGSLATGYILFLLERVFWEIGQGGSPFSALRIRQLRLLGVLFAAIALSNFLVAPGTQVGSQNGDAKMAFYSAAPEGSAIDVDYESMLIAVVCFALSLVFKYGSTIERETNDLV